MPITKLVNKYIRRRDKNRSVRKLFPSDVSSHIENDENNSDKKALPTDVISFNYVSEKQNSDFDVTTDRYVSRVE